MVECIATGLVYRNPQPHLRAIHTWHPSLVRLDSGELVATFDLGQAVESLDYATYITRSTDGGETWLPPARLFHDTSERRATHSVRLGRAASGMLTAFGGRFYRDDPEEGLTNRANLGYVEMDLILLTSSDGGRHWSAPRTIHRPLVGPSFETCHPIVELRDGRWLAPTSTWRGWHGDAPNGMQAVALVSHDRGRSWPEYIAVMDDYRHGILHFEQSIVELPDASLLAVAWAFDEQRGRSRPTPYAIAADGRVFSPPRPTGLHGQTAKLLSLDDGRVLCLYRRDDRPGLWFCLARIDDRAWVTLAEACLWSGARSGITGEGTAADEISDLKFGYPSMTRLADGDVLALFWCVEDCIHNIRWLRLRVAD